MYQPEEENASFNALMKDLQDAIERHRENLHISEIDVAVFFLKKQVEADWENSRLKS